MGRLRTVARRTFLVGSAAVAGGVAFGVHAVRREPANPLLADAAEGAAAITPWIRVDAAGVTLIGPHADLGQGAASAQAALIAEEMDLAWGQFETSFGRPSPAYWNRAMAGDGVPFAPTDLSLGAEAARGVVGAVIKLAGLQGTGGSTTIPDSFDKLRQAGASARETLKEAAARRLGVSRGDLTTRDGAVLAPGGARIPYTELAVEAAAIRPVQVRRLRDPSEWRLIGKPMERLDVVAKSTGRQVYGIDLALPGMVHASVRMNPRRSGAATGYDAAHALAVPGVAEVLEIPGGLAVIADGTWAAMEGARALEIDWPGAPYPAEQSGHWEALEAAFGEASLDRTWRDDGEPIAGRAIEAEYRCPYVAHAPLEPLSAVVQVEEAGVRVWASHQIPRQLQVLVGKVTGHAAGDVAFHNQYAGGSFGHRLEFENVLQAAEIAARYPGRPVKLTYTREEDFAQDFPRHIAIGRGRGTVRDGRVEGVEIDIASPSVIASQMGRAGLSIPGPDSQIVAGSWNIPYDLARFAVRGYRARELAPVSSWRSVGASNAGFIMDAFLDELIHAAGADPMEERIRLMAEPRYARVLEAAAEMCAWSGPRPAPGRGRGVAFVESFGVPVAEVVEVSDTPAGIRLEKVWLACDVGHVVDPVTFENVVQGGVIWGLGHAMNSEITYAGGMAEQTNYHAHEGMRLHQCPEIEVRAMEGGGPVRGIGEPPVPPAAPALANAIFAATGQRIREMPFSRHVAFA